MTALRETTTDTELLANAIDRLAGAIEQGVLAYLDKQTHADPFPAHLEPVEIGDAGLTQLPPVRATNGTCPVHNLAWKFVPAGVSKSSGKPYDGFWACQERGCTQRPPK